MPPAHSHAAIVAIGDELTLGQALDTNSRWIADRLMALGIPTIEHVTVGDDLALTTRTFARLAATCPLVIATGGLGPTLDDLTRHALAALLREHLVTDAESLVDLERKLSARGRTITNAHRTQALRPASAACLPNSTGTAPGLHATISPDTLAAFEDAQDNPGRAPSTPRASTPSELFCLPGPPGEMQPMFERSVQPLLRPPPGRTVRTRFLQVIGIGESDAAALVATVPEGDLMRRDRNPLVGITASGAQLTWRIRYEGPESPAAANAALDATESLIRAALGPHIFARGDISLAKAILDHLAAEGRTLGAVESCTGGLLGQLFTAEPGSSAVFTGGLVTYSNALKTALAGVPAATIETHGAVSRETAIAMAIGGLDRLGVDDCLAITGIAGPDGGSDAKPVGTVWIALTRRGSPGASSPAPTVTARRFRIPGSREDVRLRAARTAMAMLWLATQSALTPARPLLFEHPAP
jgi:nicotinamide-nucleotide amidase